MKKTNWDQRALGKSAESQQKLESLQKSIEVSRNSAFVKIAHPSAFGACLVTPSLRNRGPFFLMKQGHSHKIGTLFITSAWYKRRRYRVFFKAPPPPPPPKISKCRPVSKFFSEKLKYPDCPGKKTLTLRTFRGGAVGIL